MPVDPRVWKRRRLRSTYPACIAVKAAAEQGHRRGRRYLRVLREGFMCHGRKLDGPEALVDEARRAGLDAERFRIDLESNAILEAFGADLEETRESVEGLELPAVRFGAERWWRRRRRTPSGERRRSRRAGRPPAPRCLIWRPR